MKSVSAMVWMRMNWDENLLWNFIKNLWLINGHSLREWSIIKILKSDIFEDWHREISSKIEPRLSRCGNTTSEDWMKVAKYTQILKDLLVSWQIPIRSFITQKEIPDAKVALSRGILCDKLKSLFNVIVANGKIEKNCCWFVFSVDDKTEKDYLIDINFKDCHWIELPLAFEDIIGDAILNSVKYSPIWSEIKVNFCDEKDNLIISISDNWFWIKEWEIRKIFHKWVRWSNVKGWTEWFWLWLTKMYFYVKKRGGDIYRK
jgi:hypothetical protein